MSERRRGFRRSLGRHDSPRQAASPKAANVSEDAGRHPTGAIGKRHATRSRLSQASAARRIEKRCTISQIHVDRGAKSCIISPNRAIYRGGNMADRQFEGRSGASSNAVRETGPAGMFGIRLPDRSVRRARAFPPPCRPSAEVGPQRRPRADAGTSRSRAARADGGFRAQFPQKANPRAADRPESRQGRDAALHRAHATRGGRRAPDATPPAAFGSAASGGFR